MNGRKICVKVPGSTSNLGAGFDSLGLAVDRYLTLTAWESSEWHFEQKSLCLTGLPEGKSNLIYQTAAFVAAEVNRPLPGCHVEVSSELPLARGLGSSAAAIVAGIELADRLLDLGWSKQEKFHFACRLENHSDNVAASLFGGLVVTSQFKDQKRFLKACVPSVEMVIIVPPYELKTSEARQVLPRELPFETAVAGSGIANVMLTAILQNNWELAGELMEEDVFHQPYRAPLVPDLEQKVLQAKKAGAYGAALSGAGPAVAAFASAGSSRHVAARLSEKFSDHEVFIVRPSAAGACSQKKIPFEERAL